MKRFCQKATAVLLFASSLVLPLSRLGAQNAAAASTNAVAPAVQQSPVETFRKLLAMSPQERVQFLRIYPAEVREGLVKKIQEYQILPPQLRELRLRATELRWYLLPLMKTNATARAEQLKTIPEPYRTLVEDRLREWAIWPPQLKEEVLEYESTTHYMVAHGVGGTIVQPQSAPEDVPGPETAELERKLSQFSALPAERREEIYQRVSRYFEFSDAEQQKILDTLSEQERTTAETTVGPLEKWPKEQQEQYFTAFRQYASMSPQERQQFMKNVERWERMSPQERQAWRDLAEQLSKTPPYPIGFSPAPNGSASAAARTN